MRKLLLFLALLPALVFGQQVINLDPSSLGAINTLLGMVQGSIIWVSQDNTTGVETGTMLWPYNTIAEGLAVATAGDAVIVITPADGSAYAITDALVIPYNDIILSGLGSATIIDGDGLATTEHAISITGKTGCVIQNFSIQTEDGGGKTSHCIFLDNGANNTTIKNVTILDSDDDGIHIEGTNTTDVTIQDCNILDVDGDGIFVDMDASNTMTRMNIINNTVQSAGGVGISIRDYQYGNCNGNTVSGSTSHGIQMALGVYNTVDDNVVTGNGAEGIQLGGSTDNTVSSNTTTGNTNCGIEFTGSAYRNTASGNTCRTNQYGIYVESSEYASITGNVTEGNSASGVFIDDSPYSSVTGNVSTNDDSGEGGGGIVVMSSDHTTVAGNTSSASTYNGLYLYAASYCTVTGNVFSGNTLDGIILSDGAKYNVISSNSCYGNTDDGIEINAAADTGNIVTLNKLLGNLGTALVDNGAGTMLQHDNTAGTWDFGDATLNTARTTTANSYTADITTEWTSGATMASGGSNGIYSWANPIDTLQNAYSLRGRMDLRDATDDVYVNQLHTVDGLINLSDIDTVDYFVDDNISVFGGAIHGGVAGSTIDGTGTGSLGGATLNLMFGMWGPTAEQDYDVETNFIKMISHTGTTVDYGLNIETSSDMDAGILLNSHASNSPATMDVGLEMISATDKMVYGIDMSAASMTTADIRFQNGATINNGDANTLTIVEATVAVTGDLTVSGTATTNLFVADSANINYTDTDTLLVNNFITITPLATNNTTVLSPSTTGVIDTLETSDITEVTLDTMTVEWLVYTPPHGMISFHDSATTLTMSSGVWAHVTNAYASLFAETDLVDIDFAGDSITIATGKGGDYMINIGLSFAGTASDDYEITMYKNHVQIGPIMEVETGGTTNTYIGLPVYLDDLVAGDDLKLMIRNTASDDDATLLACSWVMWMLHP